MSSGEIHAIRLRPDFSIAYIECTDDGFDLHMEDRSCRSITVPEITGVSRPRLAGYKVTLKVWIGPGAPFVLLSKSLPDEQTRRALAEMMDQTGAYAAEQLQAGKDIRGDGWMLNRHKLLIKDDGRTFDIPRSAIEGMRSEAGGLQLVCTGSEAEGALFAQGGRNLHLLASLLGPSERFIHVGRVIKPSEESQTMPFANAHVVSPAAHTGMTKSLCTVRLLRETPPPVRNIEHPDMGALVYEEVTSFESGPGPKILGVMFAIAVALVGGFVRLALRGQGKLLEQLLEAMNTHLHVWVPVVAFFFIAAFILFLIPLRTFRIYESGVELFGGGIPGFTAHASEIRTFTIETFAGGEKGSVPMVRLTLKLLSGQQRTIERTVDQRQTVRLLAARNELAYSVSERILARLEAGKSVEWTKNLTLTPEGVETDDDFVSYDVIESSDLLSWRWNAFSEGKVVLQEEIEAVGFFPGLFAFEGMCGAVYDEEEA